MTTINLNSKNNNKVTRVDALNYAIEHLNDAPTDVMDKLNAIRDSFSKKPTATVSKVAQENQKLAIEVGRWIQSNFDETDPTAINSKAIANAFPTIATTQKAVSVMNYVINNGDAIKFKANGRTYYAPAGVEIIG